MPASALTRGSTGPVIMTIRHSHLPQQDFPKLLDRNHVREVVDVRITPFSRRLTQFSRDKLARVLMQAAIAYCPAGDTLGGRPHNPDHYDWTGLGPDLPVTTPVPAVRCDSRPLRADRVPDYQSGG